MCHLKQNEYVRQFVWSRCHKESYNNAAQIQIVEKNYSYRKKNTNEYNCCIAGVCMLRCGGSCGKAN